VSAAYEQFVLSALEQIGATTLAQLDQLAQRRGRRVKLHPLPGRLLEPELAARCRRVVETNLRFAGLLYLKRLEDFDFSFQSSVNKKLLEELATDRSYPKAVTFCYRIRQASAGPILRSPWANELGLQGGVRRLRRMRT
jgi:hypothetical protein